MVLQWLTREETVIATVKCCMRTSTSVTCPQAAKIGYSQVVVTVILLSWEEETLIGCQYLFP